jgi:hypothetical protein
MIDVPQVRQSARAARILVDRERMREKNGMSVDPVSFMRLHNAAEGRGMRVRGFQGDRRGAYGPVKRNRRSQKRSSGGRNGRVGGPP